LAALAPVPYPRAVRRTLALVAALIVLAVQAIARADNAENWHWHRVLGDLSPDIVLIDSMTDGYTKPFQQAVDAWNKSQHVDFVIKKGDDSKATRKACPYMEERKKVRVCNAGYPDDYWAGLTSVGYDGADHVSGARIRFNTLRSGPDRHVVCHELGHLIGLSHRVATTSCMKQGGAALRPDDHDYTQIEVVYDHAH
jgi:hypothetical protein